MELKSFEVNFRRERRFRIFFTYVDVHAYGGNSPLVVFHMN